MDIILEDYINLICSMMVAHEKFGDELNFTKNDIDKLVKKYDIINKGKKENSQSPKWNERASILLWQNGYLSNEIFAESLDIEYEDEHFWIVADSFKDVLPSRYDVEAEILDGVLEYNPSDYYDNNVDWYWKKYYTEETKQSIMEFCFKKEFEIDDELMTPENTKLKNGEIYFNDKKLVDLINVDDLNELYNSLNLAICEAQDTADQNNIYQTIENNFIKKVGPFKWKNVKVNDRVKNKVEENEKLYIRVDVNWSNIIKELTYHDEYSFLEEEYGSLFHILKENDYFHFNRIDLDHYTGSGDIDDDILNEYTQNRLDWD